MKRSMKKIKDQNDLLKQRVAEAQAQVSTKLVVKKKKNKNKKLRKQARKWKTDYKANGQRTPRWAVKEVLYEGELEKYRPNIKTTSKNQGSANKIQPMG